MKKLLLTFVFMIMTLNTSLHATTPTLENVTKVYVATFNRAPDFGGINWWVNTSGYELETIAERFFWEPETLALYPRDGAVEDIVTSVYRNLFNREPDQGGFDWWVEAIKSGEKSKSNLIVEFMNGAQNEDLDILNNKTTVGLAFVDAELTEGYSEVMEDVTAESQSVDDAEALIEALIEKKIRQNSPAILSLVTDMGDVKLEGILSANKESVLRLSGLTDVDVSVNVNTSRGVEEIASVTVSTEEQNITFVSPANVAEGELSITGNTILSVIPYTVATAQTPYLKEAVPDVSQTGDTVTLTGANLPLVPVEVLFEGQDSTLTQTVIPSSSSSLQFTVPQGSASGNVYLKISQVETNMLHLSVKRDIEVKVALEEDLYINASDISFALGMEVYTLDQNQNSTLSVENEDMQYLHAMVPGDMSNTSALLYSAVVLPDMTETVTVDAQSTAISWIFMGMGTSVTTPKEQLRSLYDSVRTNTKVQAFAAYIDTLQKEDFSAWAALSDTVLEEKFQDALRDVIQTQQHIASARMMALSLPETNSLVRITQSPENENIYFENRKSDGNVWLINDTRLFMSVAVKSNEEGKEYHIEYAHPENLIDMQFTNGILGPKGWPFLGIASEKEFELRGIDSSVEIIMGAYGGETNQEHVSTILKARTILEGVITPVTSTIISTLLDKAIPEKDAWKHVINGMNDIYGVNFVHQLQTSVSEQSNGWWAIADTMVLQPIGRGLKGCLNLTLGIPNPSGTCKTTTVGLLKMLGAHASAEAAYTIVKQQILTAVGEQTIKNAIALIPVGGWVARSALFVYQNSDEVGAAITIGETIVDMGANPQEINADVEFALEVSKVDPVCVALTPDIGDLSYSFTLEGDGFTAQDGTHPSVTLFSGGIETTTENVLVTDAGKSMLALFSEPFDFITNGSQGDATLFAAYSDGLYMMYPEWIRVIDPADTTVYFDKIEPSSAYKGATVTLKGCGWVPLDDIKVYFTKEDSSEYVEAEVLSSTAAEIKVKVPVNAQSGTVYVTAGNKETKKLFFDINPFGLNEPAEDDTLIKGSWASLSGHALDKVSKVYFTDHNGNKIEGSISDKDEYSLRVTIPEGLAYGKVYIYAEDDWDLVTNEIMIPLVPVGVDANPTSQSFAESIQVTLTQEDNVDIYYHIDEGEAQQYTGPITLNADDAQFEYFSLFAFARVEVDGMEYDSDVLEYQYTPCGARDSLVDGECVNIFDRYSCPVTYDILLDKTPDDDWLTIQIEIRNINGDAWPDDYIDCNYYESGQLDRETPYINRKIDGIKKSYYESGQIHIEIPYVAGVKNGVETYYCISGQTKMEIPYVSGVKNGVEKAWLCDSGILLSETPYINGKREGIAIYNWESGNLRSETPYIDGKREGLRKGYYNSEEKYIENETPYANDRKNGLAKEYSYRGYVSSEKFYIDDKIDGISKSYSWNPFTETSYLSSTYIYIVGILNGPHMQWHLNGNIKLEGNYVNGYRNGEWKEYAYSPEGHIDNCTIYDMGTTIGSCMP